MWGEEMAAAREAARRAGKAIMACYGQLHRIDKKGPIDLVTEADLEAERAIVETLRARFPTDTLLSEEKGSHKGKAERRWIVDPLDGTVNFAHGFPFFAVSIALEHEGDLVLGLVEDPFRGERFEAIRAQGALLNGKPIKVSNIGQLKEALVATGFPYDIHERPEGVLELFGRMVVRAQGVRRPGSAALDLCYVAAGRLDGFWEQDLKPWDTAAGVLIVREAGGKVSTFEGEPFTPFQKSVVAANPLIHQQMLHILAGPTSLQASLPQLRA